MWIFGYGSLMGDGWEKAFDCLRRPVAVLHGYRRSFNKCSTKNWGSNGAPCPTLNLERSEGAVCKGIGFEFPDSRDHAVRQYLVEREGKGFPLIGVAIRLEDDTEVQAYAPVYIGKSVIRVDDVRQMAAMVLKARGTNGAC